MQLFNKHAPIKRKRVTRKVCSWLTNELTSLMAQRDAAHRKFKKDRRTNDANTSVSFEYYRVLRNRCNQAVRNAKRRFASQLLEVQGQPGRLWSCLRTLGIGRNQDVDPTQTCSLDELNQHFSHTHTFEASAKADSIASILNSSLSCSKFYFTFVHPRQVENAIMKIKSKAEGADKISAQLLKLILPHIIPYVTNIFNLSLASGTFPSQWKIAHVLPLLKSKSIASAADFRPISILPALSKALEYIVQKQTLHHINTNKLLNTFQSGFRAQHSTCTAMTRITDDIRLAMDQRQITILVLLDYSKAFQTVDHDVLLAKLKAHFNFSDMELCWFDSYLRGRRQRVMHQDKFSSIAEITNGVPQGSILGPLLFALYLNDISKAIVHCQYHLYADDVQIYLSTTPAHLHQAIDKVNQDLDHIVTWSKNHGMRINPSKSQAILFASKKILSRIDSETLPSLLIGTTPISFHNTVKNLGLQLQHNLSWNEHVNTVCRKAYASLFSLRRLQSLLPGPVKLSLSRALVLSHLDYCDVVYSDLTEDLARRLQSVQNACIRFIFNLKYFDHLSPYYSKLGWLRLRESRNLHKLILLYKVLRWQEPLYLYSRFDYLSEFHEFNTRSRNTKLLSIPRHNSAYSSRSFSISSSNLWNTLPLPIRDLDSLTLFRKNVNDFLSRQRAYT